MFFFGHMKSVTWYFEFSLSNAVSDKMQLSLAVRGAPTFQLDVHDNTPNSEERLPY